MSSGSSQKKFLVVLDGIDECKTEDAQLNILELIRNLAVSEPSIPVLWMICSRSESQFNMMLRDDNLISYCWVEELSLESSESEEDVALFLREGFRDIQCKYSDCVDSCWPSEKQILLVVQAASGLFALASTILRHVGDPLYGNPGGRLDNVIALLSSFDPAANWTTNPTATLDLLYTQILAETPDDILPTTLFILGSS